MGGRHVWPPDTFGNDVNRRSLDKLHNTRTDKDHAI
jgi:hypothetical protein